MTKGDPASRAREAENFAIEELENFKAQFTEYLKSWRKKIPMFEARSLRIMIDTFVSETEVALEDLDPKHIEEDPHDYAYDDDDDE